jgi:hypothetical protein
MSDEEALPNFYEKRKCLTQAFPQKGYLLLLVVAKSPHGNLERQDIWGWKGLSKMQSSCA